MTVASTFAGLGGPGAVYVGPDQGIDFTNFGKQVPVYALGNGVVTTAQATGGWYNGGVLVYKLTSGPQAGRFVYTAENFAPTPGLQPGTTIKTGEQIGLATGSSAPGGTLAPGIETGFSRSGALDPYGNSGEGNGNNLTDISNIFRVVYSQTLQG